MIGSLQPISEQRLMLNGPYLSPASGAAPTQIVVLLHGRGSNGADLLSLGAHWRDVLPNALFIAPDATERVPDVPDGLQWWNVSGFDRAEFVVGAARAAPLLDAFLDDLLAKHSLAPDRMALVGFSQGAMMALHVGPRRPKPLAGIIGYSGMLADPCGLETTLKSRPPVLLVHAEGDPVVPVAGFYEAGQELRRLGFDVSDHASPGGEHGIDKEQRRVGSAFLRSVLA